MKLILVSLLALAPFISAFAEDNGNRGLSDFERKRILADLRRGKIISSVRRAETMTDAQILELHNELKQERRLRSIERKLKKLD